MADKGNSSFIEEGDDRRVSTGRRNVIKAMWTVPAVIALGSLRGAKAKAGTSWSYSPSGSSGMGSIDKIYSDGSHGSHGSYGRHGGHGSHGSHGSYDGSGGGSGSGSGSD